MSKKKKKDNLQFDLEAQEMQPLVTMEEGAGLDEIEVLKGDEKDSPIEMEDLDRLFNSLLLNHRNQKVYHNEFNDLAQLLKKKPTPKLKHKNIIKVAINTVGGGGCVGGLGYLIYDFVTRLIKKSQLEDLWDNWVVDGSYTCAQINGHGILNPNYPVVEACGKDLSLSTIAEEICKPIHDEYCDKGMLYYIIPEGIGIALIVCILFSLLATLLYCIGKLLKPCYYPNSHYDNHPIDQILSTNRLSQLKSVAGSNQLLITDKMKRTDVLTNIEHFLTDDLSFIKTCLKMKIYAHWLFRIIYIDEDKSLVPHELAELIFLYVVAADKLSTNLDKQEKSIEVIQVENEGEKEVDMEAKDNLIDTSFYYKQSTKFKTDLFGRFFGPVKEVPSFNFQNPSIIESNVLQVFRA